MAIALHRASVLEACMPWPGRLAHGPLAGDFTGGRPQVLAEAGGRRGELARLTEALAMPTRA
ncbi:MAG: hypothetical protein D6696_07235 [Acidobacteria bacterium]|nr:MAG: hypothetical protein D6696_07235 [Acidobacteriota bacterium]